MTERDKQALDYCFKNCLEAIKMGNYEGELILEMGGVGVLEVGGDDFRDEGAIGAVWGELEVGEAGLVD